MADFKVPNLCGASPEFNAIQTKFESMMTSAIDGLEVDASALKTTLDTDVASLVTDLKAMIPKLPSLPNVNLQAELTSLSGLSAGSFEHGTLLAEITTKFGSALTASGFSLDSLVSDAASAIIGGTDLCSAVPNFEVPAIGGDAVQKAIEVLQPAIDSLPEKVSVQLPNPNVTTASTNAVTSFNKFFRKATETETLPTADTGAYTVASKSTAIAVVSQSKGSTIEVTTPSDQSYQDGVKTKKKNTSPKGITTQTYQKTMDFIDLQEEAAWTPGKVGFLRDGSVELQLEHIPIKIISVGAGQTKIWPKDVKMTPENYAKFEFANNSNAQASYDSDELFYRFIRMFPPNYNPSKEQRPVASAFAKDTWTMDEPGTVAITRGGDTINGHIVAKDGKILDQKQWVYYRIVYSYLSKLDPN